ncbi:MAG: hypothetical protein ACRDOI_45530 [Trebonia sp.]
MVVLVRVAEHDDQVGDDERRLAAQLLVDRGDLGGAWLRLLTSLSFTWPSGVRMASRPNRPVIRCSA